MPAMAESMEAASGMQEGSPKTEERPGWWATPAVVGLLAFAAVTILFGLSELPKPYCTGFWTSTCFNSDPLAVMAVGLIFGGFVLAVMGLISLRKGNLFAGSAFVSYGGFWFAYAFAILFGVAGYGFAGFTFVWVLISLTFLINSLKHGWMVFVLFLLLAVQFILMTVFAWQLGAGNSVATGEHWAIGGEIILTGIVMWYVATADLTNWNYGRRLLPG
jgi:uncharacterized protein